VLSVRQEPDSPLLFGKVDFSGVRKDVCLAYTPEVKAGDYVLVHVGFALSIVDEEEAQRIFEHLQAMEDLAEEGSP
jgi:hydrogenase expression/formation protein HypC